MKSPMLTCLLIAFATVGWTQDTDVSALIKTLGIRESPVSSQQMAGWKTPEKIALLDYGVPESGVGSLAWFSEVLDGTSLILVGSENLSDMKDVDAYLGWCSADHLNAGKKLQYIHVFSAGLDGCMAVPGIGERGLIATNSAKAASETIAEHSIALVLALTRRLHTYYQAQMKSQWARGFGDDSPAVSLQGKTMLVLGLGGIGNQVARRAHDLGMRVIGTRNSSRTGPDYVDYVGLSPETNELARQANIVVNALPMTSATAGIVDAAFFSALPDGSYYVSVGRGGTTDTASLIAALQSGKLSGAGLDVTDPEPLPADHPLWKAPNVIITPHTAAASNLSRRNTMIIARENLRRYAQGEPLLNLVDLVRGY